MNKVGNPNLPNENTNYFSSANQPARRGRLPSRLRKFVKDNRVSKADVDKIFSNLIFGSTLDDLQEMVKEENRGKLPMIVVMCIQAFIADMKRGKMDYANSVLDRLYGKPCQSVEVAEHTSDIPSDPDERAALAERIKAQIDAGTSGD